MENIIFKIDKELKKQLKIEAKARSMTLSSYIKMIISERGR